MSYLKTFLGESYKEDLNHEQIGALLEAKINALTKEKDTFKAASDKNASEAKQWKDKYTETLSEAEKQKLAYDEIIKQNNDLVRDAKIEKFTRQYIALGYDEELAKETALAQIDGNLDKVFENQKKFNDKVNDDFQKKLLEGTPAPANGDKPKPITKEDFKKMGYEEMVKLQQENPVLYAELSK